MVVAGSMLRTVVSMLVGQMPAGLTLPKSIVPPSNTRIVETYCRASAQPKSRLPLTWTSPVRVLALFKETTPAGTGAISVPRIIRLVIVTPEPGLWSARIMSTFSRPPPPPSE
jgi:hypothetical protein